MSLFDQVIDGKIPEIIDEADEFLTTEAVYAETLPYMRAFPRIFNLPKGNPLGKGNLCFVKENIFYKTTNKVCFRKNEILEIQIVEIEK